MTNNDVYKYLLSILRKSRKGNALSPSDFTQYLQQANLELFNQEYAKFEATQRVSDSLRPFKATATLTVTALTVTESAATLPTATDLEYSEYFHIIPTLLYGTVPVDFVTVAEYLDRKGDTLTAPSTTYPVAYIDNATQIKFDGVTSGSVTMYYIRKPDTPYFDYYVDANYEVQYLTEGQSTYTLQTGEVYRDGTTAGSGVDSISVELDWNDSDKIKVANIILGYLGVQLEDQAAYQHSNVQEQQDAMLK